MDSLLERPVAHISSRVKRALILNDFAHIQGGASKVAIDEALALAAEGLEVHFIAPTGPQDGRLADAGVSVTCLDSSSLSDRPGSTALLSAIYNRNVRDAAHAVADTLSPDDTVVHLHGFTKSLSLSPLAGLHRRGFKILCTLHDFFLACPNGAFFDYRANAPCDRRALSLSCLTTNCDKRHFSHKLYRIARSTLQGVLLDQAAAIDGFIGLSRHSVSILRHYLPASASIHWLENIIEVDTNDFSDPSGNDALICVGRLDAEKGVLLAAQAARQANLPLTFVGEGPLRQELTRSGFHVTGWLDPAQVGAAIRSARCLVFPSLWYETYGLVVSEAASRGIPSIVSDLSAPAERIEHNADGWIFESGSRGALANVMRLTTDDETLARVGRAAHRKFWSDPPTARQHARKLIGIYDSLLAKAR